MHRHELLIHERSFVSGRAIGVLQIPAAGYANPERLEIAGAHRHHRDLRGVPIGISRPPLDRQLPEKAAEHRRIRSQAAGPNRTDAAQSLFDLPEEHHAWLGLRVLRERQVQAQGEDLRRVGADVHLVEQQEAAHHERGAGEEHERQRHFGDDQCAGPAARSPATGTGPAAGLFHHLVHIGARDLERRREAEEHAGRDADARKERDHHGIDGERHPVRFAKRRVAEHRIDRPDTGDAQHEPHEAADDREHDALDQQLPDDSPSGCTERDSHGNLSRPLRRPRQQQVRDIRARNQQDEADRPQERVDDQLDLWPRDAIVVADDRCTKILVRVRVVGCQSRDDGVDLAARFRQRHAGRQTTDHLQVADTALGLLNRRRQHREREPHVVVERKLHFRRHDRDDGEQPIVDLDHVAEDLRVRRVPALPDAVTQDDDRFGARLVVGTPEVATELRPLPDQLEKVRRVVRADVLLGGTALFADVERRAGQYGEVSE